jgi:hypothetical protein
MPQLLSFRAEGPTFARAPEPGEIEFELGDWLEQSSGSDAIEISKLRPELALGCWPSKWLSFRSA